MVGFWTEEREAQLRKLHAAGKSGGEMAAAIGCSRNAAIGKCYRLHLVWDQAQVLQNRDRGVRKAMETKEALGIGFGGQRRPLPKAPKSAKSPKATAIAKGGFTPVQRKLQAVADNSAANAAALAAEAVAPPTVFPTVSLVERRPFQCSAWISGNGADSLFCAHSRAGEGLFCKDHRPGHIDIAKTEKARKQKLPGWIVGRAA